MASRGMVRFIDREAMLAGSGPVVDVSMHDVNQLLVIELIELAALTQVRASPMPAQPIASCRADCSAYVLVLPSRQHRLWEFGECSSTP